MSRMYNMANPDDAAAFRKYLDGFRAPIYEQLMEGRCTNCRSTECHCCVGCGQTDADIIGSHGYHCVL